MPVRPYPAPIHALSLLGLSLLVFSGKTAWSDSLVPDYRFLADIQMQGEKSWAKGWGGNNLDNLWGRLNFGAEYKDEDFSSKFNVRIFPEAFGFEPVINATYDTVGQGNVRVQTSQQSKVLINHAWVKQQFPDFAIRVGRIETRRTPSFVFGDYIDLAPGISFGSRQAVHNATELTGGHGEFTSSLLLGTNDRNLNRGFIRVYETWTSAKGLDITAAFRSNLPDKVFDQAAAWQNRAAGSVHFSPGSKWGVYAEGAMIQVLNSLDQYPVLAGLYFPAGILADKFTLEGEYLEDRVIGGEERPLMIALYGKKRVFKRVVFDAGIFTDPAGDDVEDMGTAIRFTCALK